MEFIPEAFSKVPINTYEPNLCSPPEPEPEWRGILLKAPEEAVFLSSDKEGYIPVCGYYQLEMKNLSESGPIKLNVILQGDDKIYSGFVIEEDSSPSIPKPFDNEPDSENDEGDALGGYFNPDLIHYVKFPIMPGMIKVYAEYGRMTSDTLFIKIQIK